MAKLPKLLLDQVVWILRPTHFADRDEFNAAVRDYHVRILDSDERWRPEERVLAVPKLLLCFECWEGEDQNDITLELATEDPEGWTTLDLLYAIHQQIVGHLQANDGTLGDHCFFEGLSLRSADADVPVYDLDLGS
jgi:hypothetical protein